MALSRGHKIGIVTFIGFIPYFVWLFLNAWNDPNFPVSHAIAGAWISFIVVYLIGKHIVK